MQAYPDQLADNARHKTILEPGLLHIHFGAGRLGLGLICPFLHNSSSELYILNRTVAGANATGRTGLSAQRRNHLLAANRKHAYLVQHPSPTGERREAIPYEDFFAYSEENLEGLIERIVGASTKARAGVLITASILTIDAYASVVRALNVLCRSRETGGSVGPIFLAACENTISADEVMAAPSLAPLISPATRKGVACVRALVDRICVGLEEACVDEEETVVVRTEGYGSLVFELSKASQPLAKLCEGSRVEFSSHVDVEKQIKGWLLNGGHNLIAVAAFHTAQGDRSIKLNQFLNATPERRLFAARVMDEMREGISILLRSDPGYAAFVKDYDLEAYLSAKSRAMLDRFLETEDPITRILARFQAPVGSAKALEAFAERFGARINPAIEAYEREKGQAPPTVARAVFSVYALVAAGKFIDAELSQTSPLLGAAEAALAHDVVPDPLTAELYVFGPPPPYLDEWAADPPEQNKIREAR